MFSERTRWDRGENALARALAERRRSGAPVLDLTESNPTAAGFRYGDAVARAWASADLLSYRPDPRGLAGAREAVSGYYREHAAEVAPEDLILTSGTSEAYA